MTGHSEKTYLGIEKHFLFLLSHVLSETLSTGAFTLAGQGSAPYMEVLS
jgi:hypothetical protein